MARRPRGRPRAGAAARAPLHALLRRRAEAEALPGEPLVAHAEPVRVSRRVLLVEDNGDVREALRDLLEVTGHRVHEAADGLAGVQVALEALPDVALVDVGLPELDGFEVARRIRASPLGASMVLVALTGYGGADHERQALEAGFDLHLVKPVELTELERLLRHLPMRGP